MTNSKLFKWDPDGWQSNVPPTPGTYLVRFEGQDEHRYFRVEVTPLSETDAAYHVGDSDPLLLPPGSVWKCEHQRFEPIQSYGEMIPRRAICSQCGANGRLITREDLVIRFTTQ